VVLVSCGSLLVVLWMIFGAVAVCLNGSHALGSIIIDYILLRRALFGKSLFVGRLIRIGSSLSIISLLCSLASSVLIIVACRVPGEVLGRWMVEFVGSAPTVGPVSIFLRLPRFGSIIIDLPRSSCSSGSSLSFAH